MILLRPVSDRLLVVPGAAAVQGRPDHAEGGHGLPVRRRGGDRHCRRGLLRADAVSERVAARQASSIAACERVSGRTLGLCANRWIDRSVRINHKRQ